MIEYIEYLAVIFSLLCVWYTSKNNRISWIFGIFGIFGYMYVFLKTGSWANFSLQFLFLYQSVNGWNSWGKESTDIRNWSRFEYLSSIISIPIVLSTLLIINMDLIDSFTTTISLVATSLLVRRVIQSWIFWIVADVFYIVLFLNEKLYASSILYLIFLLLAIFGFINWKRQHEKN